MNHPAGPLPVIREARLVPTWLFVLTSMASISIALISYRYLGMHHEIPEQISTNSFVSPWLTVHAGAAATALLIGPAQFLKALRARHPGLHPWMGRVYVLACTIGGASGLMLAAGASTGIPTVIGFGSLALTWLGSTSLAWVRALQGHMADHRAWMIRSFALTLAAVTLRLYLTILEVFELPFVIGYQAISFLCWVPNLILAEWLLRPVKRPSDISTTCRLS